MKKISILALETCILSCITETRYMFSVANEFLIKSGREAAFDIKIVGLTKEVKLNDGLFSIYPDLLIDEVTQTDLIIIPAISGEINEAIEKNQNFILWIIDHHANGSEVASLCIGAFILASTGLMDGKSCSTHWLQADEFKRRFPQIELVESRVITDQNGLYSSGGATSYWNLLLYLIEKFTNRELAILISKYFLLDINRDSQSPFIIFKGQKEHQDEVVMKTQEYIEQNYNAKISIDDLSNKFGVGRRTFERRFKRATSNTVIEYAQRVKVEVAKKQLEIGKKNVTEVMYEIGYSDTKAFRDVFKKYTGISPIDYRNKYYKAI